MISSNLTYLNHFEEEEGFWCAEETVVEKFDRSHEVLNVEQLIKPPCVIRAATIEQIRDILSLAILHKQLE